MKKNVLKAMSVGLSAITIASTLSVPVYADEPVPEPISAPTEPAENQGQQVGDVTVKEKSPLKVTEDVDDIAKELPRGENLPKAVEGEITEENPANVTNHLNDAASELHDLSGKDSIDEVEDKFDEGEIDLKKDEQKGTTDILNTLEGTASVEIANVALEFYDDAAQRLEGTASKAASDADAAASNLSGASLTQANIDSARELVNQANQAASDADKAVKFAGAVLLLRQNNLNTLLKENGLSEVSEEDLETLYAALTTDDVESDLLDTLDGNAKEAIVAAKKALDKATDDAAAALQAQNNAKSVVASLAEDLLTQIALKQEAVGKESATEADVAALAKFVYEYYLQKTLGDSYLKGSLSLTGKTSVDGVNYYEVSYKKTGDEVPSLQGYAGYKKSEDGKNVIIYAYTKTEENTNEVINPATPESWKTADGTKEYVMPETPAGDYSDPVWVDSEDHDKGFYQIGDINKLLNDKIKPKDIEVKPVGPDWKKVEGTEKTEYSYFGEVEIITGYQKKDETKEVTKEKYDEMIKEATKLLNNGYTITVSYKEKGVDKQVSCSSIDDLKNITKLNNNGKKYTIVGTKKVDDKSHPIKETVQGVLETVTQKCIKDAVLQDWIWGGCVDAYIAQEAWRCLGYDVRYEMKTSGPHAYQKYRLIITQSEYKTISKNVYQADKYTEKTDATEAEYGKKDVFTPGNDITGTSSYATEIGGAKQYYDEQKAIADDDLTVANANAVATTVKSKLGDVIDAVKEVLTLKEEKALSASILPTILDIIAGASNKINNAQNLLNSQNQGGPTGGPSGPSVDYSVIPTISSIPEATILPEAVPLAAPTRRVRQVAGVVEEEATEEELAVEETPEETTEVTVTETEENPVVINDEDVARAGGTQSSFFARTWWAWLILVIAAIGGAVGYTKKKSTDLK